ncbi:MAG: hypothetical protein B7C24_01355 [Bacteroidetes bacterium 4572_77]|nr:MAG: hypothetical protein B7C24_01355 [Bacteroidetes bacterium 4572_77]
MKIRTFFLSLFVLSLGHFSYTQNEPLNQTSNIDDLLALHKSICKTDSLISGYRVQIFFESGNYSKDKALQTAEEFQESFPNTPYYLSFNEPYYRIRVGDYRTLIEAKGFLSKVLRQYPSAFEVKDLVYFPALPKQK